MAAVPKELLLMVIQYLREENMIESAHMLEKETGVFFDLNYFAQLVVDGKFDEAEKYVSGFTKVHDNMFSTRIFFELRRQKYLEALDKKDKVKALDILQEFKVFAPCHERILREAVLLLPLENFRQHDSLALYGDPRVERIHIIHSLKKCFEENPVFRGKLEYPFNGTSSLRQIALSTDSAGPSSGAKPNLGFQL